MLTQSSNTRSAVTRLLLYAAVLACGVLAATFGAWQDMARTALNDEESGHILLVPIVVLWLIWVRRARFKQCAWHSSWLGPVLLAGGWVLWSYGYRTAQHTLWELGAILALVGAAVTFLGNDLLRKFLPAFLALLFLIPVWPVRRQQLAYPLQLATATATQTTCELLGMNVVREGNLLVSNGVNVAVAEACNGMRMVLTLALVSYAYAFVTPLRTYVRVLVLAAFPLTAIACNVVRLVPTVWVYGHCSAQAAERFHDISGWVMLGVALLILMGLVRLLRWAMLPVAPAPQADSGPAAPSLKSGAKLKLMSAPVLSVILVAGMSAERFTFLPPTDAAPYHLRVKLSAGAIATEIGPWTGKDVAVPYDVVDKLRPNVLISRTYENLLTGRHASLLVVQCRDAGALAGHFPPTCYHNQGYLLMSQEPRDWDAAGLHIQGTQYEFGRSMVAPPMIAVANFIVMPDGRIVRNIDPVNEAAADIQARYYGAAECQIIVDAQIPQDERDQMVRTFAEACAPLIRATGSGYLPGTFNVRNRRLFQ